MTSTDKSFNSIDYAERVTNTFTEQGLILIVFFLAKPPSSDSLQNESGDAINFVGSCLTPNKKVKNYSSYTDKYEWF